MSAAETHPLPTIADRVPTETDFRIWRRAYIGLLSGATNREALRETATNVLVLLIHRAAGLPSPKVLV